MTDGEFMDMEQRIKDHIDRIERKKANLCKWSLFQWAVSITLILGLAFYCVNEIRKMLGY